MIAGIYEIIDGKNRSYIGSSGDVHSRWQSHKRDLTDNSHHSFLLQRAWTKHGAEFFRFRILEFVQDLSEMRAREQYWIDITQPFYNISPDANRPAYSVDRLQERRSDKLTRQLEKEIAERAACEAARDHVVEILSKFEFIAGTDPSAHSAPLRTAIETARRNLPILRAAVERAQRGRSPYDPLDEAIYDLGVWFDFAHEKFGAVDRLWDALQPGEESLASGGSAKT